MAASNNNSAHPRATEQIHLNDNGSFNRASCSVFAPCGGLSIGHVERATPQTPVRPGPQQKLSPRGTLRKPVPAPVKQAAPSGPTDPRCLSQRSTSKGRPTRPAHDASQPHMLGLSDTPASCSIAYNLKVCGLNPAARQTPSHTAETKASCAGASEIFGQKVAQGLKRRTRKGLYTLFQASVHDHIDGTMRR